MIIGAFVYVFVPAPVLASNPHASPDCIPCPGGGGRCEPNCGGGCNPVYEPVDIYNVHVTAEPTTVSLSWDESPAGSSTTLYWGTSSNYGESQIVSGSGSYSVPFLDYVEPGATNYYEIHANPPSATCNVIYTAGTYSSTFYIPDLWIWNGPGITSNGFSGATPSNGLCSADLGGGGGASSSPNPPSVNDATGTVEFELTATADTCAIWQVNGNGGFYTPAFVPSTSAQYTFTYAWTVSWNSAFDCFIGPFSSSGSQGNLQILGNLVQVSNGEHVSSSDVSSTIVSWDWAIGCFSGASGNQLYSDSLTADLVAGQAYHPYSYVSSWIYTEATGDASAQAIMNVGNGGDYGQLSWVSLLYDG
jgi:hypothetical protein